MVGLCYSDVLFWSGLLCLRTWCVLLRVSVFVFLCLGVRVWGIYSWGCVCLSDSAGERVLTRWGSRLYSLWEASNPIQVITIQSIAFLERHNDCLEWGTTEKAALWKSSCTGYNLNAVRCSRCASSLDCATLWPICTDRTPENFWRTLLIWWFIM